MAWLRKLLLVVNKAFAAFWYLLLSLVQRLWAGLAWICCHLTAGLRWLGRSIPRYLTFYILIVVVGYAVYLGSEQATVISPLQLPPEDKAKPMPFSGETVANVLRDAIIAIRQEAEGRTVPPPCDLMTTTHEAFGGLSARATTSFAVRGPISVEVKGLSVDSLVSEAREVFGRERVISGDVFLDGPNSFRLMARANDSGRCCLAREGALPLSLTILERRGGGCS